MNIRNIIFSIVLILIACFAGYFWFGSFLEKPLISTQDLVKKTDTMLTQLEQQGEFSGAVLIAKNGEIVLNKGYGMADWEKNIPITSETKFAIGSISKTFTAMLILLLAQEGKLKLNDPVQKYLKNFKHSDVTIYQLLTHTSGLPHDSIDRFNSKERAIMPQADDSWGGKICLYTKDFFEKDLETIYTKDLLFEPGTKFEYSNAGYTLLTTIINQIDGSYATSLEKRILKPLDMKNTFVCKKNDNQIASMPKRPSLLTRFYRFDNNVVNGFGSMISTTNDLYRFAQCLNNNELLSPELAQIQKTIPANISNESENLGYACGLSITNSKRSRVISHEGMVDYFNSCMGIITYPKTNDVLTIIVLSNQGEQYTASVIIDTIKAINEGFNPVLRKLTDIIPPTIAKQYEGIYELKEQTKETATLGIPIEIVIKADRYDTLWSCFPGVGVHEKLLLEKEDVFGSNIIDGAFTYTFLKKDNQIVGFKLQPMNVEYKKIGDSVNVKNKVIE